jgi:CRP/FNR family cyclic AMP-dependent transcriptional regulator
MPTIRDMLAAAPWTRTLAPERVVRIERETLLRDVDAGHLVCRKGERVEHWVGVVDIVALRRSTIAYMPRATFMTLLDESVAFNRFLLIQLNERLGQFIGLVERDRLLGPDARLARGLAALFNPHLYPGSRSTLPVSQEELGQLVGLSRQRVNRALRVLEARGLLRVEYAGVTVLDLAGLREFEN